MSTFYSCERSEKICDRFFTSCDKPTHFHSEATVCTLHNNNHWNCQKHILWKTIRYNNIDIHPSPSKTVTVLNSESDVSTLPLNSSNQNQFDLSEWCLPFSIVSKQKLRVIDFTCKPLLTVSLWGYSKIQRMANGFTHDGEYCCLSWYTWGYFTQ